MDILGLVTIPGWLLTVLLIVLSLYLYSKYKLSFWSRLGVPYVKPTLLLGNVTRMGNGIGEFDLEMFYEYDKVIGTYILHKPSLLLLDPKLVRDVMIKNFSSMPNRTHPFKSKTDLHHAVSRLKGDHWRFMRNTLSPIFASGKMRKMCPALTQACQRLFNSIEHESRLGNAIEFKRMFGNFTMDAIASLGFGMQLDLYKEDENEFVTKAKEVFLAFGGLGVILDSFMPPLYKLLVKLGFDMDGQSKHCLFFRQFVEQARTQREKGDKDRADILQLLLDAHNDNEVNDTEKMNDYKSNKDEWKKRGLTNDEINGNSIAFMIAGYDTTASALTFTAYCLATNPECQDKLLEEIDSTVGQDQPDYDNTQKMEYLDCVIKEALRLYTPAQRTVRETDVDLEIAGYNIPKNTEISIPIYALHRHPKYWKNPIKYDPDRFLAKNKSNLTPYTFLPFGLGPRSCIAMRLAYLEAKCALVTILQKYKFVPCDKTEIPLKIDSRVLLKPKNGLFLEMEERKLS
ncbi:cytochrome P450 3A2-like [Saccostrea echinata]|uniref:cytochrome P450 3A2-like n=1 Tax=Saccostrea echinata TaxID=191078 RepID=UPI002A7FF6CE|nr:cytochrome P450 3A2-like [Saccostrea echinata]